jgi:BirA family biotin operon repressor/biotin-[acetyl-CoA-carboxylase] ligase
MSEPVSGLDRDRLAPPGGFWRASVFRETESTNDLVRRAAEGGEAEGLAVFAEAQTQGRGQFGRRWDSAPGLGLWFSLLLCPRWPAAELVQMTPLIAVAVVRALSDLTGLPIRLKAPNDVFCGGRKLAGILSEARSGREVFVVVGIGLNVNHGRSDFPLELQTAATSLAIETGQIWDRNVVGAALLAEVGRAYEANTLPGGDVHAVYAALSSGTGCANLRP